jgi:hypothetical protein
VGAHARNDTSILSTANMTRRMPSVFIGGSTGSNLIAGRVALVQLDVLTHRDHPTRVAATAD